MPRWVSLAVFFRKWGQCSTYSDSPSIVFYKAEVPFKCAAAGHCKVCASMIQGCLRVLTFAPGSVCSCRCRRAPSHWQPPSLRGAPTPQQSREERERGFQRDWTTWKNSTQEHWNLSATSFNLWTAMTWRHLGGCHTGAAAQPQVPHSTSTDPAPKSLQPCLSELTPHWESRGFRTTRGWYFVPSKLYYILVLL